MQGIELQRVGNGFSLGPSLSKDVAELKTQMRRLFDERSASSSVSPCEPNSSRRP
ncbi:MAG TPA: hypothetical protein VJN70_18890 [Gemmatimonadaceae bacterium]|nr:hypothetical protein [Gemmatimonadaceae bacterium]